jgi:two-component system, OmpR family, alkaline phosphatase synthesis response regulator PhoP
MPGRLLIVEDEVPIALGLKNDLTLEGYLPEIVSDGDLALERARTGQFDLIVLDVMLPKRDGLSVCRDLRRAGIKTPIIFLTARAQDVDKVMGLELGADDYITKPFSPMELCARIKAVLRRARPERRRQLRFGSVAIDFELKVREALLGAGGRLLSRDDIIDRVWGPGVAITDRVVDNHVLNLRRKLEDRPADPRHIVSVRGLGYRFENPDASRGES